MTDATEDNNTPQPGFETGGTSAAQVGSQPHRSGFVAVVGRPNVGKSTLMNALLGTQVAITSSRPETTRKVIRGILTLPQAQIVLVDTPGIHRPRTLLGQRLNDMVDASLADADSIAFLLPADQEIGPGDRRILSRLRSEFAKKDDDGTWTWRVPVVAVVTKIDLLSRGELMTKLMQIDQFANFTDIVPVSAQDKDNVDELVRVLVGTIPEGPQLYPTEQISEESKESQIAELVRGVLLEELTDELPHSLAVVVDSIDYPQPEESDEDAEDEDADGEESDSEESDGESDSDKTTGETQSQVQQTPRDKQAQQTPQKARVSISLYVERSSQKPIVIGHKAEHIVRVKKKLRTPINRIVGMKTNVDIYVKVAKNWQSDPKQLDRLGFMMQ
ncbi:GTPase Era [Pseudoscardovia suis]|uniref:GTPase Era n=1 Tax=Pseudoscardovia suis TaxID=987063 RepID=UPI003F9CDAE6